MPDVAERSTDIGITQSTVALAAAAQISPSFLHFLDMTFSLLHRNNPEPISRSVEPGFMNPELDVDDSVLLARP